MSETKFEFYSDQHGAETIQAVETIFADGAELKQGVFINAPCGCGKSYFVQHDLVRYAATHGHSILLLVPRLPLKNQFVLDVGNKNTTISIRTYQHFEQAQIDDDINGYDIIVCDEAHYFVSDAAFNGRTLRSLERIFAQPAIKIFMTATPRPLYTTLHQLFPDFKYVKFKGSTAPVINDVQFFADDFNSEIEAGVELLLEKLDQTEDKAIIFCHSIKMAWELYNERWEQSMFMCSASTEKGEQYRSGMDEYAVNTLLKNKKFDCKYLFTTSVSEVGITIHDKQVKHIVCCLKDWNSIVQAIGRKRMIDDTDTVTVYLADRTAKALTGSETRLKKAFKHYDYYKQNGADKYTDEFYHVYDPAQIVWKEPKKEIEINPLALAKWEYDRDIVKEIRNTKKGNDSYRAWVYKQLELTPYEQRLPDKLQQQLEPLLNIPFTLKGLKNEIAPKINYVDPHNNRLYTSCSTLNDYLQQTQTPLYIATEFDKMTRKNTYTLRKIA